MTGPDKSSEFEPAESEREAERAAVLKKAELLAWAYERQAAREAAAHEASKPRGEPAPVRRSQGADMTRDWQNYIKDQIARSERASEVAMCGAIKQALDARERAVMKAVAQIVVAEERAREALAERVKALEAEIATLRGARGLRAVPGPTSPTSPASLIA
jgi:hypothetical protein